MSEVSVEINGRKYRMACEDGQEEHLQELARRFNAHTERFKGDFGEIGDNRLTVMAGIAVMDELYEAERQIEALKAQLETLSEAGQALAAENEAIENRFAQRMSEVARKVELAASTVESAAEDAGA